MTKNQALELIDTHKNKLINPMELLDWTWLRVIIAEIDKDQWEAALNKALNVLSQ